MMLSWIYVLTALSLDIVGTIALKLSTSARHSSALMIAAYVLFALSIMCFGLAMKKLELGFITAVWAGGGLAVIVLIGMVYFNEAVNAPKILFLSLVIAGIIGLSLQEIKAIP